MSLKKIKSLFWVSEDSRPQSPGPETPDEAASAGEVDFLSDEFALPKGESADALPSGKKIADLAREVGVPAGGETGGDGTGPSAQGDGAPPIDFQLLYDEAEIPNTDEVEALEKFLDGLEDSLPQSSKLAAAKAFLGAIGKGTEDVMRDAGQKIRVVRALLKAKEDETQAFLEGEQKKIAMFERQIEKHRVAMEQSRRALEGVRKRCGEEESRLQAARIFFGHMAEEGR